LIHGVRHTGIVVNDIKSAISFWVDSLEFEVVSNQVETGEFIDRLLGLEGVSVQTVKLIAKDKTMIELLHFHSHPNKSVWGGSPFSTGPTHLALNVSDIDVLIDQLKLLGYLPLYAVQVSPNGKVRVCYIPVFEGLLLELVETL
jgi:catechol 2,3-dioxygenase-like lactoylglutathione lyase family enzyme